MHEKVLFIMCVVVFLVYHFNVPVLAEQYKQSIPSISSASVPPMFSKILLLQNSFDLSTSGTGSVFFSKCTTL